MATRRAIAALTSSANTAANKAKVLVVGGGSDLNAGQFLSVTLFGRYWWLDYCKSDIQQIQARWQIPQCWRHHNLG